MHEFHSIHVSKMYFVFFSRIGPGFAYEHKSVPHFSACPDNELLCCNGHFRFAGECMSKCVTNNQSEKNSLFPLHAELVESLLLTTLTIINIPSTTVKQSCCQQFLYSG